MPHGYCTECEARVTVRDGLCLLGHRVDPATIESTRGRRVRRTRPAPEPAPPPTPVEPARSITLPLQHPTGQMADTSGQRAGLAVLVRPDADPEPPPVTRSLAPTGSLVARLWDTSGETTPIDGWELTDFEHGRSAHEMRRLVLAAIAVAALVIAGWYAAGLLREAAAADLTATTDQAELLVHTGAAAEAVATDLADGVVDAPLDAARTLGDLDGNSRRLFDLASDLPPESVRAARLRALDASQQALDVEAGLGDAVAYEAAFHLLAVDIELPVRASDEELPVVAAGVAAWVSRFVDGASGLPGHPLVAAHRSDVHLLADHLADWQSSYLDALRRGDASAAEARIGDLERSLDELEAGWTDTARRVADWAAGELATLRTTLDALTLPG